MQVYKLIIHMLFGVIFYSTKIYSQVTIDYTNSRINTLSKFSSGGSIILGTESKDTIADTLIKSYASSYEATSSKTTCSINKINNTLRIRFDILNKHNGMRGSDSKTTIHLPLLLHSQCKYLLSGNYQRTGKNKVTFETILHTNIDTLFKNIQLSINQISPFFELDTVIADSIQCMGGNISGVLNVEQDAILDINIGIYGINATSIAAEGSGYY